MKNYISWGSQTGECTVLPQFRLTLSVNEKYEKKKDSIVRKLNLGKNQNG